MAEVAGAEVAGAEVAGADAAGEIVGRVSDGRTFLDDIAVTLFAAGSDTPLAAASTGARPGGDPASRGWFVLRPATRPAPGTELGIEAGDLGLAMPFTFAAPAPEVALQLMLVAPDLRDISLVREGKEAAARGQPPAARDSGAPPCASCWLSVAGLRQLLDKAPALKLQAERWRDLSLSECVRRLTAPGARSRIVQGEAAALANRLLGRPASLTELELTAGMILGLDRDDPDRLPGDAADWRSFAAEGVTVDYALGGEHALPAAAQAVANRAEPFPLPGGPPGTQQPGTLQPGAAPAVVQQAALLAARARDIFVQRHGMRDPGPLRVRLCLIAFGAQRPFGMTQPEWNHLRINCLNTPEQNRGTVPHEVFHRIQFRYNASSDDSGALRRALREGGAALAEDCFDGAMNRWVLRAANYVTRPFVPMLTPPDAAASQDYAAVLFWRYLEEQAPGQVARIQQETARVTPGSPGLAAMGLLLNATATQDEAGRPRPGGYTLPVVRQALVHTVRFDRCVRLAAPDGDLAVGETILGNWLVANCLVSEAPAMMESALDDRRFRYAEATDKAQDFTTRPGEAPIGGKSLAELGPPILVGDQPKLQAGRQYLVPFGAPLAPWAARYFRFGVRGMVRVQVRCLPEDGDALLQLVRLDADMRLEILRADGPVLDALLPVAEGGRLYLVVGTRAQAAACSVRVWLERDMPLAFVTPMNCAPGTSYETDARQGWRWTSPDIALADPDFAESNAILPAGRPVQLAIRVANRGTAPLAEARVRLDFGLAGASAATCRLQPAQAPDGSLLVARGGPLAPGQSAVLAASWIPPESARAADWLLRATPEGEGARPALGRLGVAPDAAQWGLAPNQ